MNQISAVGIGCSSVRLCVVVCRTRAGKNSLYTTSDAISVGHGSMIIREILLPMIGHVMVSSHLFLDELVASWSVNFRMS